MYLVVVRVTDPASLTDRMQTMRTWLDHRRLEPCSFRYDRQTERIRLGFNLEAEAAEFARVFSGSVLVPDISGA